MTIIVYVVYTVKWGQPLFITDQGLILFPVANSSIFHRAFFKLIAGHFTFPTPALIFSQPVVSTIPQGGKVDFGLTYKARFFAPPFSKSDSISQRMRIEIAKPEEIQDVMIIFKRISFSKSR